jgi:hypothetical protein
LVVGIGVPGTSHAQAAAPPRIPGLYTIERETRERWMNARQMPLHTPHVRTVSWIAIDSLTADSAGRRIVFGRASDSPGYGEPVRLTLRADGHVLKLDVAVRESRALATARTARDSLLMARFGLVDGVYLRLPNTRLWDATLVFRPPRVQRGARWIDTVAFNAEFQDLRQSLTGIRVYTLVRDTMVGGRRLWWVRDSATVRYADSMSIDERQLTAPATVDRKVAGVIIGRSLYDPEIGLFRVRADTTTLRGEARLGYPDGRTFASPTRFERSQRWSLYERPELADRMAQLRARADSNSFSIVLVPRNPLEERIAAGHAPTIDSLFAAWRDSRDPDGRVDIKRLLGWGRDSSTRARFAAARAAEGDTAYLVGGNVYGPGGARLTMNDVDLLLPLMRDPGLAFQHGVSRDIPYERVVESLIREPPAIQPDSAKWPCEPAACRRVAAEFATATEPRLKSAALAVLTLMDPRRWRDTYLTRARAGDNLLRIALPLVIGQAVPVPVMPPPSADWPPVPSSNADWTRWRDWLRGPLSQPPVRSRGSPTAIRFAQAATGRDIVAELRALFSVAPDDNARVVIGNILAGLDALPWTIDSVAAEVRNGTPLRRAFAADVLLDGGAQFRFEPADGATAETLQEQFLTGRLGRREPWRTLDDLRADRPAQRFRDPPTDAVAAVPVYYATDDLAVTVRARWSDRIRMMSQAEWSKRPAREGGELWAISRVEHVGPFARLRVMVSGRNTRSADQGPNAWHSWMDYYLMNIDGEWVLVTLRAAVT